MYKMIIVDDEAEIRIGLSNYFPWNQLGFEVVYQCVNGKQAIEYIEQNTIDLILTDIRMPVMDGIELAKELHKRRSFIYIIFLSGYKDFQYAKEALKYGVKEYIVKPGKFEEIHEVFTTVKAQLDKEWSRHHKKENYIENIIQTIEDYIKKNYADICLEDIATVLKMSPNYISRLYKEKTGDNISNYITKTRMQKAAELLVDYHYKTYEISEAVGYNNPKNFTRTFKKYYGVTPRDFRNSSMERSK
ncbi:response regulator [Gracilibacillus salitolerans]|uniref:Response regulator n=1 Tax=Gracilibacillus salitolerans TaxID=2663022 RepID=A0A5Q2TGK3_9BACI|nr:response regulator [Gracilibacillus salitolerans]QGH33816.1 response regulator [Gracilibacillus salitolerans]